MQLVDIHHQLGQFPLLVIEQLEDQVNLRYLFHAMPKVYVTLENGVEEFLFEYYPDEISFTPNEFVGLTIEECKHLKFVKDKNYLTS